MLADTPLAAEPAVPRRATMARTSPGVESAAVARALQSAPSMRSANTISTPVAPPSSPAPPPPVAVPPISPARVETPPEVTAVEPAAAGEPKVVEADLATIARDFTSDAVVPEDGLAPTRARGVLWAWVAANILLVLVLSLQYVYFYREQLVQTYPAWRPALTALCAYTQCTLPLQQDRTQITIGQSKMVSHPTVRDALRVSGVLVNAAPYTQPFPVLQLSLTDPQGRIVAMRYFQPSEYLGLQVDIKQGLKSGVPIEITLDLLDPDKTAIGFAFEVV